MIPDQPDAVLLENGIIAPLNEKGKMIGLSTIVGLQASAAAIAEYERKKKLFRETAPHYVSKMVGGELRGPATPPEVILPISPPL